MVRKIDLMDEEQIVLAEENRRRNTRWVIISVILAIILGILLLQSSLADSVRAATISGISEEAHPYELELREIKDELSQLQSEIAYESETAKFMVGFEPNSVDDFEYINEQAEVYGFSPVILIDCTDEMSLIKDLIQEADDYEFEIMLTASKFSESENESVMDVLTYLNKQKIEQCGVFLLRSNYETSANKELLIGDGFTGYVLYSDYPKYDCTDEGIVSFDYSYIRQNSTAIDTKVAYAYTAKASELIVFDLEAINDTLSENGIANVLDLVDEYVEEYEYS